MNERYLIVNADDFGMTQAGDAAIAGLMAAGRITSTCILAPARRAEAACALAAQRGMPAGVHWTLNAEWADEPWQPAAGPARVPSLCQSGALYASAAAASKAATGRDVTRELSAQTQFLIDRGVTPDHADSHCGTLYGINGRLFFVNAFKLCRAYGLPFRFPKRPAFLRRQTGREPSGLLRAAHAGICALARGMGVRLLDDFLTNPYPVGKIDGYEALSGYYERELSAAGPGVTEVFLHPSLPDNALLLRTPEWQKRVWEYEYLTSDAFDELLRREGFTLCSWRDAPFTP